MRKLVLLVVALATLGFANAQFEAKINPLGAMFGKPDISGEYVVSDNFGVELSVGFAFGAGYVGFIKIPDTKQSGFGVKAVGKYYFSPDDGGDGWYMGIYLRQESLQYDYDNTVTSSVDYDRSVFAGGLEVGKKWVFDSGFLVESGFGLGRPFSESRKDSDGNDIAFDTGLDGYLKFAIGYRFN